MTKPLIPEEPIPELQVAELGKRVAALERLTHGMRPALVGELIPYSGPVSSLSGEVEVQPGYLLCNGADVSDTKWPALAQVLGTRYGTAPGGMVRLPSLLGRMLVPQAATGTFSTVGATGGTETHSHTVSSHSHTIDHGHSVSDPGHSHSISITTSGPSTNEADGNAQGGTDIQRVRPSIFNPHTHSVSGATTSSQSFVSVASMSGSSGYASPGTSSASHVQPYQVIDAVLIWAGLPSE